MAAKTLANRVLAIGLDGYETSLGNSLMAAGELPALSRLRERSARFLLDHGSAQRTGLAMEHVSSGLSPEDADRWSSVGFDRHTYHFWQEGTSLEPFVTRIKSPTVVFDPPYFDLGRAPLVRGVVAWGAHDPGVELTARPDSLHSELEARFGAYPARPWLYGIVWPSAKRAELMGQGLAHAAEVRADAATWLLKERLPEWKLGIVVSGEIHSAIEGLWHGVDPTHPLHKLPSAQPAREGLLETYRAVDRMVGKLAGSFNDATVVVFAMGGMGPNKSDIPSMVLLPELLYREAFGKALFSPAAEWLGSNGNPPMIDEDEEWAMAVNFQLNQSKENRTLNQVMSPRRYPFLERVVPSLLRRGGQSKRVSRHTMPWMTAAHYQRYWPEMRFFALPSFYDGRVRINLEGRERDGKVPLSKYSAACDEVEKLVRDCRDSITGEPVVEKIERYEGSDPRKLGESASDLVIVWRGISCGFDHKVHGRLGPVPFRRTGGHTGPFGMAYISGREISAGDFGVRSSFDVVPTIIKLLGEEHVNSLSGRSLL